MSVVRHRRALFLDRDGVINVDHGYVHRPEQVEFVPGIFDLVRAARRYQLAVVVVTNQAGIARGLYGESDFQEFSQWMLQQFESAGAGLERIYHCPYHAEHGIGQYKRDSDWRKPAPGMLLQAAQDLHLNLADSLIVGDQDSDMEAGRRAGLALRVLYAPGPSGSKPLGAASHVVSNLQDVVPLLKTQAFRVA